LDFYLVYYSCRFCQVDQRWENGGVLIGTFLRGEEEFVAVSGMWPNAWWRRNCSG